MSSRVRWVGIASLAVLLASPCRAAEATRDSSSRTGSAPGRGAVGGLVGASYFYATDAYSKGALPRFDFSGRYRYVISPRWRGQVSPGFTWAAYSKNEPPPFPDRAFPGDRTKERYLTLVTPVSAELQLTWGRRPWHYYLGAGPGLYRVWVENHRKVLIDPQTDRQHRGIYWGTTAELGVERFLKGLPSTSVEVSLAHHFIFAQRDEQFPTGWSSSLGIFALRAGANYYFDLRKPKQSSEVPLPGGLK